MRYENINHYCILPTTIYYLKNNTADELINLPQFFLQCRIELSSFCFASFIEFVSPILLLHLLLDLFSDRYIFIDISSCF